MTTDRDRNTVPPHITEQGIAQFYRGELGRSDRWRTRLDTTSNWALTTAAAAVSYAFSTVSSSHLVLLVGVWMVTMFLSIEARRYRYYDLWIHRVRLIEAGYWAPVLRQEPPDPDALKELAAELERPQIRLTLFAAIATRMNRAYGPILGVLLGAWFIKIYSHPTHAASAAEFFERAHVGPIPGVAVAAFLALFAAVLLAVVVLSFFLRPPAGELHAQTRRKMPLWETFTRPYALRRPNRAARAPVSSAPLDELPH